METLRRPYGFRALEGSGVVRDTRWGVTLLKLDGISQESAILRGLRSCMVRCCLEMLKIGGHKSFHFWLLILEYMRGAWGCIGFEIDCLLYSFRAGIHHPVKPILILHVFFLIIIWSISAPLPPIRFKIISTQPTHEVRLIFGYTPIPTPTPDSIPFVSHPHNIVAHAGWEWSTDCGLYSLERGRLGFLLCCTKLWTNGCCWLW